MNGLRSALGSLFADPVDGGESEVATQLVRIDPRAILECTEGELSSVANAVEKRRVEFASGRRAARSALQQLGLGLPEILPDPVTRAPMWPAGVVGSITHSDDVCAAVCMRSASWDSVGLDVEPDAPLEDTLRGVVCTPDEDRALSETDTGRRLRWTFSAKEAFYKAQHPLTHRFLEFTDVELRWEHSSETPHRAGFEVHSSIPESAAVAERGVGRLVVCDGWVFTSFVVSARRTD